MILILCILIFLINFECNLQKLIGYLLLCFLYEIRLGIDLDLNKCKDFPKVTYARFSPAILLFVLWITYLMLNLFVTIDLWWLCSISVVTYCCFKNIYLVWCIQYILVLALEIGLNMGCGVCVYTWLGLSLDVFCFVLILGILQCILLLVN